MIDDDDEHVTMVTEDFLEHGAAQAPAGSNSGDSTRDPVGPIK